MGFDFFDIGVIDPLVFGLFAVIVSFFAVLRPLIWLALLCAQPNMMSAIATVPGGGVAISLAYVAVAAVVLGTIKHAKWRRLVNRISVPVALLLGWASISFLLYPTLEGSAGSSISRLVMVGSLFTYVLIVISLNTFEDIRLFLRYVLLWLLVVQVLYAITMVYAMQAGVKLDSFNSITVSGVGLYFAEGGLTLILVASYFTRTNLATRTRVLLAMAGMLGLMLLLVDGSRTKLVVALLTVVFIAWQSRRLTNLLAGSMSGILLVFLFLLVVKPDFLNIIFAQWEGRLAQSTSSDIGELSTGRDLIYEPVWNSFLSSPLLGVGVGNATEAYEIKGVLLRQNPHSFYLGLLGQQGLLGLTLFVVIVAVGFMRWRYLWRSTKIWPQERQLVLLVTAMIGYGVLCMTVKADYGISFWALALLEVLYQAKRRENSVNRRVSGT